ncbi:MAG: pyruvoyl-dependent arginine decarboxylase [Candidatus Methanofastidiosia archaeon]
MLTPKKFVLLSSSANATTSLNAFDEALRGSKIANFNFIPVSSILPKGCTLASAGDVAEVEEGSFVPCVMSKITSDKKGALISSAVACIETMESVGCITEFSGFCDRKIAEEKALGMGKEMVFARNATIRRIHIVSSEIIVEKCGCSTSLCLLLY